MLTLRKSLRCCSAYLKGAAARENRTTDWKHGRELQHRPSVLIADHRDDFFRPLKEFFEAEGVQVLRATAGSQVTSAVVDVHPDVVIIHERLPDESGWLISCKLRLRSFWQPVWIYAETRPLSCDDWKELSGVDEIIEHRGLVSSLLWQIRPLCTRLLDERAQPPRTRKCCHAEFFHVA